MKTMLWLLSAAMLTTASSVAMAQEDHAYTEGPVVVVNFVRSQPGMFDEYMRYLDKSYKPFMDEAKKAGADRKESVWFVAEGCCSLRGPGKAAQGARQSAGSPTDSEIATWRANAPRTLTRAGVFAARGHELGFR